MTWKDNTIMSWNGTKVSDHNRGPLSVTVERIGTQKRMANGTMRAFHVTDKRTWSCSWESLPDSNAKAGFDTADGGMAAADIESFHESTPGTFTLTLRAGDGTTETVTAMFTEFSKVIAKRGDVDLWDVTVGITEV